MSAPHFTTDDVLHALNGYMDNGIWMDADGKYRLELGSWLGEEGTLEVLNEDDEVVGAYVFSLREDESDDDEDPAGGASNGE